MTTSTHRFHQIPSSKPTYSEAMNNKEEESTRGNAFVIVFFVLVRGFDRIDTTLTVLPHQRSACSWKKLGETCLIQVRITSFKPFPRGWNLHMISPDEEVSSFDATSGNSRGLQDLMAASVPLDLDGLSRKDALEKISGQIACLNDPIQIRSLKTRRNTLVPVGSLSPQLLRKVFMHCCELNESGKYTNLRENMYEWEPEDTDIPLDTRVVVSWVSRRWRNLALTHGPLWSLILSNGDTFNWDYARACMDRCKSLQIDARCPSTDLLKFCVSNISKISLLKLVGEFEGFVLPKYAPLLETLSLGCYTPTSILRRITSRRCPRLRFLELDSSDLVDWKVFPRLALTITKICIKYPDPKITAQGFTDLLESLTVLTDCEIWHTLKKVVDGRLPSRCVSLPLLQKFAMGEALAPSIQVLRYISAPTASFDVCVPVKRDQEIKDLFRTLRGSQGHVWNSIRHLRDGTMLDISISTSSSSPAHTFSVLEWEPAIFWPTSFAYEYLDLKNLESLWTNSATINILAQLSTPSQLHTITLNGWKPLRAFIAFVGSSTHLQHSKLPFPALRELRLAGFSSCEWLKDLYRILATRQRWGIGMRKLLFIECEGLEVEAVVHFIEVVEEVEVSNQSVRDFFDNFFG
ncbi:hypothetical protein BDN72DRAFT_881556 [Pluteus cervinus]|uniref:Uncharacterized protein n=1 Tax=Pluteus cervinus TaxID=181527 RepID=A0ACD3AF67_9AGAR|nr:hypothetical protein BDN72DRAFT_881556 [Pluteus cervinus]